MLIVHEDLPLAAIVEQQLNLTVVIGFYRPAAQVTRTRLLRLPCRTISALANVDRACAGGVVNVAVENAQRGRHPGFAQRPAR